MGGCASDRFIAAIRSQVPLEAALGEAAEALCAALQADGIAIALKRDGRVLRAQSGSMPHHARAYPLTDPEVDGTLSVGGKVPAERARTAAAMLTLALAARFLGESAQFDGLTGVLNRRSFDARLREEWLRAQRSRTPLAIAMIDIDYFKAYNDRRGHQAGDDVLRRVAQAAAASLQRAGDRFARYGGEEFAVILPETDLAGAIASAENMRAAVRALRMAHPVGKAGRVTVSIGVASTEPVEGGTPQALLDAADHELYRAKALGRNRVAAHAYASPNEAPDALPQPLGTLVGREDDVAAVVAALERHDFVTLTGPGGVGKTRLALAAAQRAHRFEHVRFVDVLGTLDRADVIALVGAALDLPGEALLIVDGCEQVTDACRAAFRDAHPPVRVLATSRVPLGVPGEHVIRLQPLDDAASRALFVERSRTAGVVADPDDASTSRLLRRLGGMPLSIELAIAQLRTASVDDVFAHVQTPHETAAQRPTFASLLANAIEALTEEQFTALAAVAVFASPFSAEAAAAVIPLKDIDECRAATVLAALADASLLEAASYDGVTRWRIIDPVRAAAHDARDGREVRRTAVHAHLRWCLSSIKAFDARFGTVENEEFCRTVAPLSLELKAALHRALAEESLLADGMDLCTSAVRYWFASGQVGEARARCEAYLDVAEGQELDRRLRLLNQAMRISFAVSDFSAMERYARTTESLIGGEPSQRWASTLNYLGLAAKMRGEYDVAEARFRENRDVSVRIGYRRGEAVATGALGTIADDVRLDFQTAVELYARSAEIFREIRDDLNATIMTSNTAVARTLLGDLEGAREPAETALREARNYGYPALLVHALDTLAALEMRCGNFEAARVLLREAIDVINPERDFNQPLLYVQIAHFAFGTGRLDAAVALLGAADAADARHGTPTQPIERFRREPMERSLQATLGADRYAAELERGKTMADADVIAAARRILDEARVPA